MKFNQKMTDDLTRLSPHAPENKHERNERTLKKQKEVTTMTNNEKSIQDAGDPVPLPEPPKEEKSENTSLFKEDKTRCCLFHIDIINPDFSILDAVQHLLDEAINMKQTEKNEGWDDDIEKFEEMLERNEPLEFLEEDEIASRIGFEGFLTTYEGEIETNLSNLKKGKYLVCGCDFPGSDGPYFVIEVKRCM